ncbi:uncharacterized protein LOC125675199 isoform X2 [Ostrea edulis]|nr:uncharacterized protein LOC125675199 isoform X2 [Ostrea edulis]XP_056014219.1 uncharacterized protein LOC125675199 isoform X2 [Ostrea edulis]
MKLSFAFIIIMLEEAHFSILDPEFCEISKLTREVVESCPTDEESWIKASVKKNCSLFTDKCTGKLEYHCVINPWQNLTVEVCAPSTRIRRGHCAEYNHRGGKIQEFYIKNCKACTEDYTSTDAYQYQECYSTIYNRKRHQKEKPELRESYQQLQQPNERSDVARQTSGGGNISRTDITLFVTLLQVILYNRIAL